LQKPQYRDKYQSLSINIQQYIRNSIKQVSQVQKAERYQRKEQKKESLLIYFWVVAAIALVAGGIYLVQQESKFKAPSPKPLASAGDVSAAIQASSRENVEQPLNTPPPATVPPASRPDTAVGQAGIVTPPPAPVVAKPAVKKDTVKAAVPVTPKPVVKPDTVAKKPAAQATPPPAPVQKDSPAPAPKEKKEEPKVVVKEKEKEKEKDKDDNDKKPVMNSCTRQQWFTISRET
jgi:cytoskeletal protein RodZ